MVNKGILVGVVDKDPEIRFTNNGSQVANFTLITHESWEKKGQENIRTDYHKITAWGSLAEKCEAYRKDFTVYVEGRIQTRSWEKDGIKRYVTEINATDIRLVAKVECPKRDTPQGSATPRPDTRPGSADVPTQQVETTDESIPF